MSSKNVDLDSAKKDELRNLCKKHGVKGYGKLSNDQMRGALRALIETDPNYQTTGPKKGAPEPMVTAPAPPVLTAMTTATREERNGVKRPKDGGLCAAVWSDLDKLLASGATPTTAQVRDLAAARGWNPNNALCELSAWRKFMGLSKSQPGKHGPRRKPIAKAAPPAARVDGSIDHYSA